MSQKRSALAELVIVVLGVLLALAADAAMGRVRERESAQEAVEAVLEDVIADSVTLATHLARIDGRTAARQRLADFLLARGEIHDSLTFLSDIHQASLYTTFDANTAAFVNLTGGGGLDLIEDQALRSRIVSYYTGLGDVSALDLTSRAAVLDAVARLMPRVVGGLAWDGELLGNDELRIREAAAKAFDSSEIHRSGALRELLIATTWPFETQSMTYARAASAESELILLLRDALERGR